MVASNIEADLVIQNGQVLTVNQTFSIKEAVAVKNGKIIAVGQNDEIKTFISASTKVIDLKGKTILPGINDSHIHGPFLGATRPPVALDLTPPNVCSLKDMVVVLTKKAQETPPGEWIRGFGWDISTLEECKTDPSRLPRKEDIDAVSPDNPVIFTDFSAHNILVNSKAMEIAGVSKNTPDPASGEIERDPISGEPTGLFKELGAQSLISEYVPLLTREEKKQALFTAMKTLNANGITSYTDAAIGPGGEKYVYGVMSGEFVDIYRELLEAGELTTRVTVLLLMGDYGSLSLADLKEHMDTFTVPRNQDKTWLNFPGIKIFADGIPPTKTAWMAEEYVTGGHGSLVIPGNTDAEKVQALKDMIMYVHSKDYQLGIHTCGDKAIEASLEGILDALNKYGNDGDLRHYIIHGDFLSEENAKHLADNNLGVSMQPMVIAMLSDFAPTVVGQERATFEMPYKRALNAGLPLTFSSDAPCTSHNWLMGVQSAVLRENLNSGRVNGPEQCVTVEEAIRAYTINGAWQDHMESVKGSIEVGKVADFCVIDGDILAVDPHEIGKISVVMTIIDGKVVYSS